MEWTCALPDEMQFPPNWLTGRSVDELEDQHLTEFSSVYEEFMEAFEKEEKSYPPTASSPSGRANTMRDGWRISRFWYYLTVASPRGICTIFDGHIRKMFLGPIREFDN